MKRRLFLAGLVSLIVAGAAAFAVDAVAQKRGGTLITVVHPEPSTLAVYLSTAQSIPEITSKVYEGLLDYDFDLNPRPALAKSWSVSPDGKTVTFKLQSNVTWQDGKPFTSADVKFSVMEVLKKIHPRGAGTFKEVVDVETPDPLTAVFKLSNPAPYMLTALSAAESPMVPKHLFEGTDIRNNPQANKPVGTGPFVFTEWKKGSTSASTATRTTGRRACRTWIASWPGSFPRRRRARPRSRAARCTWGRSTPSRSSTSSGFARWPA